jgi:tetratricopeptide (TPR) repeat protein
LAINKRKILESAQKSLQKGALDKALKDYTTLLEADPRDANVRLKIGDIQLRRGKRDEAITAYLKVAQQFMNDGFDAKAVALYKQISKIDPMRHDVQIPLAELYQRLGLTSEAMSALQTAADAYHRDGRKREALELLRKMATLDPSNTTSRLKIADLLRQADLADEAIAEYEEVAAELDRQGEPEEVIRVHERILEVQPQRTSSLLAVAQRLLDSGKAADAETFARRAVAAVPDAPEGYELLTAVLRARGVEDGLHDLVRRLAEIYRGHGDEERARELLQRWGAPGPLDVDLGSGGEGSAPGPAALDTTGDGVVELADEAGGLADAATGLEAPAATSLGLEPEQILAEASVYLRFGKHERAIATLETLLLEDPDHVGVLEKLAEAAIAAGDHARAREALGRASAIARERGEDALLARLQHLTAGLASVGEASAGEALAPPTPAPEPPEPPRAAAPQPPSDELDIDVDLLLDEDEAGAETPEPEPAPAAAAEVEPAFASAAASIAAQSETSDIEIEIDELELEIDADAGEAAPAPAGETAADTLANASFDLDGSDVEIDLEIGEPSAAPAQVDALDPNAFDAALEGEGTLESEGAGDSEPTLEAAIGAEPSEDTEGAEGGLLGAAEDDELEAPSEDGLPADEAARLLAEHEHDGDIDAFDVSIDPGLSQPGTGSGSTTGGSTQSVTTSQRISEELEEADFYFQQGLYEEAQSLYRSVLAAAPNHPQALLRLGEIALARGEDPSSSASHGPAPRARAESAPPPLVDEGAGAGDLGDELLSWDEEITGGLGGEASEGGGAAEAAGAEEAAVDSTLELSQPVPELIERSNPTELPELPELHEVAELALSPDETTEPEPAEPELTALELSEPEPAAADAVFGAAAAEVEADAPTAPAVEPVPTFEQTQPGLGEGDFDLRAELEEALEAPARGAAGAETADDGFAAVFQEFKRGVARTLDAADHETHYDLGIAYREMGLFDDAVHEFEIAMEAPGRRAVCLHMLGLCELDLGRPAAAVPRLEQALAASDLPEDEKLALHFDLGRAFEAQGDVARARARYEAVHAVDPGFMEVAERLAELERGDKPEDEEGDASLDADSAAGGGEAFESFDDLFGEDDTSSAAADEDGERDEELALEDDEDAAIEVAAESALEAEDAALEAGDAELEVAEAVIEVEEAGSRAAASAPKAPPVPPPGPSKPRGGKRRKISFA